MGDGSRHTQRSDLEGDARAGATNFLPGRNAKGKNQSAREEVAGSTMAKGARFGGGEALRVGRRTLCAGEERRAPSQRDRHAAQAIGSLAEETACHAQELTQT